MQDQAAAVIQSLIKGFNATDRKDWETQRSLWADELTIDFGEVKEPQRMKADDLIAWARIAYKNMTTMHLSFNHEVKINGDKALVHSYGRALHQQKLGSGDDFWFIYNKYEHDMMLNNGVWKISRLKMTPVFQEGNANLVNQAYEEATK